MRKAANLGVVLLATSVALAQIATVDPPWPADGSVRRIQAEKTSRTATGPARVMQADDANGAKAPFGYDPRGSDEGDGGAHCPQTSFIVGQDSSTSGGAYFHSDLGFCDPNNPANCRRVVAENFPPQPTDPPLTQPIHGISWYGSYVDGAFNGCVKANHTFRLQFYNDDGTGKPVVDPPVATFNVTANARVVDTINWSGGRTSLKYAFWATLPSAVTLAKGHVSICGTGSSACWYLWGPSLEGNHVVYRWYEQGHTAVTAYTHNDVAYCFGVLLPGACCNDWSGVCDDHSDHFSCHYEANLGTTPPGGRFTTDRCQDFDPPCGRMWGACCKADETCAPNLTRVQCAVIPGAYWRGPQTTCEQCCWIPECPGGAHVEQEPCGQNTNGGCGVFPNRFETVQLQGTEAIFTRTVCGTLWADDGLFDEDWYEFTAPRRFFLTLQNVNTQIPIRCTPLFNELHGPPTCADLWYHVATLHEPCVVDPPFTPPDFPGGRYWVRVSPEDANGLVNHSYPCGTANEYSFEVVIEYVTCPNPCCIPGVIIVPENEPDYCANPTPDTFNSGCDKTPPGPYLPLTDNFEIWCGKSGWYDLYGAICRGDLNCDDYVDFGDINPFVLALANWPEWMRRYPGCPDLNADINGDGHYGGSSGFGDINPFVALLASTGGQPLPCPSPHVVPDTDWYRFEIVHGPKRPALFLFSEFPVVAELYQASAGCAAPALERHEIVPCEESWVKTFCLPNGAYWLRILPRRGVECGKEYALGLEEFVPCTYCAVTCPTPNVPETEPCGQNTNGGCQATPNVFEQIACDTTICGSLWADDGARDTDWFRLVLTAPRYLIFTLHTEVPTLTGFFDTREANCAYLYGLWRNTEDCAAQPDSWTWVYPSGQPVLWEAGTYWWTLWPDDDEGIFYGYPCQRPPPFDLNTYWFEIECTTVPPR